MEIQRNPIKHPLSALSLLLVLLLTTSMAHAYRNLSFTSGSVAAIGVETDDRGNPMLSEYDSTGGWYSDIGFLGVDPLVNVTLMSAKSYRAIVKFHEDYKANNPNRTSGARVISREQYLAMQSSGLTTPTGELITLPPIQNTASKSVYITAERNLLTKTPLYESVILQEYPVDMTTPEQLPVEIQSLIIKSSGEIHHRSNYDISYKVALYKDNDESGELVAPIGQVIIDVGANFGIATASGADGKYALPVILIPCPGFNFHYKMPVIAKVPLGNFNPKATGKQPGWIPSIVNDYKVCLGLSDLPPAFNLQGLMAQLAVIGIEGEIDVNSYNINHYITTMQLNAIGTIADVELGATLYESDISNERLGEVAGVPNTADTGITEYRFDFDGDGQDDTVVQNPDDATKVDVYLGGKPVKDELGNRNSPDISRFADFQFDPQYSDQGMLKSISIADLEDTDIYIYRVSTGQLIATMEGLNPEGSSDASPLVFSGVHENNPIATFGFSQLLMGAPGTDFISSRYIEGSADNRGSPWRSSDPGATNFDTSKPPDYLRPGELINIIAINRATGYIGSQKLRLEVIYNTPLEKIIMGPPNLKIIATRTYKDLLGLSAGEQHDNQVIGSEGAALTSDTYVKIQTVWLARDGSVLPDNLPGYTGRLAVSSGNSTEDFSENFEIKPGYQTEFIQLNNALADLTTEHFYVQVVGENFAGNPNFADTGAGEGALQSRPAKYVPIKVPLFNELATLEAQNNLRDARQQGVQGLPDKAEPVYQWVYRPEMQFSVFDLQRQQIEIQNTNDEIHLIDLSLDNSAEILGSLLSGDLNYVDLLYDLTGSNVDALEFFGPDRQIVLSLGAEEVEATVTPGGSVRFENSQSLDLLERDDYLLVSLYLNNDSANVLWEFAFEKIHLIADMNNDGQIIKQSTAKKDTDFIDTINSKDIPFLFWINNDDDEGEVGGGKGSPGDIPNDINPDYANDTVDGMRDLVDFFPVYIDIKAAINSFPPADYTYRLMHFDSALKFIETDLVPISTVASERIDAVLKHPGMAASLANASVTTITKTGVELSASIINKIRDDKGIILIEATGKTEEPLRLEIVNKSNQRLAARAELALNIDNVETMYRNIDLKPLATRGDPPDQGLDENIAEPTNNKDDRTQPNYLAFIHGYNVSPEAARGWNAELFKRYHRLGFNGRFIATNWHGDTGLDYHNAVYNAFQTGMGLKTAINRAMPETGTLTIAAHSLGNMVASNAIAYGNLTPAKYFMINAATPIEAYDSAQDKVGGIIMKNNMTEVSWKDYPEALYTANWHELFAGNPLDNRNQLTWKNHFSGATSVAYNFYSRGDEVVENANAIESFSASFWNNLLNVDFAQHAWVMQEMGKGCNSLVAWSVFKCSGGWEFNKNSDDYEFIGKANPDYVTDPLLDEYIKYVDGAEATAARDNTLADENLAQYGFFFKFNHFENDESEYSYLYKSITNTVLLLDEQHQWDLLASAIPAMSFAAAANPMDAVDDTDVGGRNRNFNMETLRGSSDPAWPFERSDSSRLKNWLHSDIRDIALPYVYQTLDTMLVLGDFKK